MRMKLDLEANELEKQSILKSLLVEASLWGVAALRRRSAAIPAPRGGGRVKYPTRNIAAQRIVIMRGPLLSVKRKYRI